MTEYHDRLQCPLCEGQGEVHRSRLIDFASDPDLKTKIDACLASVPPPADETTELVGVPGQEPRDFQKEVHSWNPRVLTWRRSPKE
jgi:hypothetical protein